MSNPERVEFRTDGTGRVETRPIAKAGSPERVAVSAESRGANPKAWACSCRTDGTDCSCARKDLASLTAKLEARATAGGFWANPGPPAHRPWQTDAGVAKYEADRAEVAKALKPKPAVPVLTDVEKAKRRLAELIAEGRSPNRPYRKAD